MSNLPPNPYNNVQRAPQVNANQTAPAFSPSQQPGHVPLSQLPPGYAGTKQDANSNSPLHAPTSAPQNHALHNVNNYSQSGSSSPAFNQPGVMPPSYTGVQSSPIKPPVSIGPPKSSVQSNVSTTSGSPSPFSANPSPIPYSQNVQPLKHQINDNAPPLVPSSQFSQPLINGPPNPTMSMYPGAMTLNQFPATSNPFNSPPVNKQLTGGTNLPLNQAFGPPVSKPAGPMTSQQNTPFSAPLGSAPRNSPLMQGPPVSGPPLNALPGPKGPLGPPGPISINGPSIPPVSGLLGPTNPLASGLLPASKPGPYMNGPTMSGPPMSGPTMSRLPLNQPMSGPPMSGPPMSGQLISGLPMSGPPMSGQPMSGPGQPVSRQPMTGPQISGPPMSGPPMSGPPSGPPVSRPSMSGPPIQPFSGPPRNDPSGPMAPPSGPQSLPAQFSSGPQSLPAQFPPRPQQPPMGHQMGPPGPSQPPTVPVNGPPKTNMQSRYPQMQPGGYNQPQMPPQPMGQYPQQYNTQNMTQQMGNLSVTKQGFSQLWGQQTVDLMQCKHILPEYPEELPEIKLGPAFPDAVNCSPE